jgi:hypothetical protein
MQLIMEITDWESNLLIEEILSKTIDPKTPLGELEYYELSLLDEANDLGTRHRIRQAHGAWSKIDGQIMWDQEEVEYFWILAQAKERYAGTQTRIG